MPNENQKFENIAYYNNVANRFFPMSRNQIRPWLRYIGMLATSQNFKLRQLK